MQNLRLCAALLAFAPAAVAQANLAPETLLLARIKYHMHQTLERQPNYTCMQSIERSRRRAPSNKYEPLDTVRLEVALVDRKEMFSWPGARKFEDAKISDLVKGGAIGNGNFALHARSVFLSNAATFTFEGERIRDGRRTVRFDYRIPQYRSGYTLKIGEQQGIVGYYGSFWVDAETLDLIRLEVIADDIPPHVPVSAASDIMEYGRVKIGVHDFLLPVSSEMTITDLLGNESRNRTKFMNCRQYTGESVLIFDDPPEDDAPAISEARQSIHIPEGLELELKLMTALNSGTAVGDPVQAIVERAAKHHGAVIVPKGASVGGRVTGLQHLSRPVPHYVISLEFSTLEFNGVQTELHGIVRSVSRPAAAGAAASQMRQLEYAYRGSPAVSFLELGTRLRVPRGIRLVWRAGTPSNEETK